MSNRARIVTCQFHDVIGNQPTGRVYKGYRMFDDYGMTYSTGWDSIPSDGLEILKDIVEEADETAHGILQNVRVNRAGILINGRWYNWGEIKGILDPDGVSDSDSEEQGTYADPEWEKDGGKDDEVP